MNRDRMITMSCGHVNILKLAVMVNLKVILSHAWRIGNHEELLSREALPAKVGPNLTNKRRPLGQYSSLADQNLRSFLFV
jgi:hypothetical protein